MGGAAENPACGELARGSPRAEEEWGGAAPGFPGFPSWGPGLMLMEGRSQASEPPPTPVGAHSQQPCSLIGTPGLASRASQITAWLALPMAATPSSGYRALPEGGLVPDKGCHSAGLWAEPGTQAWRGAARGQGEGRRPGSQGTWAGDRAMLTTKTHLPASGRRVLRAVH